MMMSDWLLADDIEAMVDDMVHDTRHPAFHHNGLVHLYSGPSRAVARQILGADTTNHKRAEVWAKKHGATLIDETRVGKFLINFQGVGRSIITGKGTFDYFAANERDEVKSDRDKFIHAIRPWKHSSRLLIAAAWGYLTTTSNGAARDGVYYTIELPCGLNPDHLGLSIDETVREILNPHDKKVEKINFIPFDRIFALYQEHDYEMAHRLVGLGEQRMALHEALRNIKPANIKEAISAASKEVLSSPVEAYEYFLYSQERYKVDQNDLLKLTATRSRKAYDQTPVIRQQIRDKKLEEFGIMAWNLIKTELDLLPVSVRPAIEVPACLTGKIIL